jgi:hypothetical protein
MGPAFAIPGGVAEGLKQFSEGNYLRGWESMTPKVLRDLTRAYRIYSQGERTLAGRQVKKPEEFSSLDIAWQALGFKPAGLAEVQAGRAAAARTEEAITEVKNRLIRDAVDAQLKKNTTALTDIKKQIRVFNKKYPEKVITVSSLLRAALSRKKAEAFLTEEGVSKEPRYRKAAEAARFANP